MGNPVEFIVEWCILSNNETRAKTAGDAPHDAYLRSRPLHLITIPYHITTIAATASILALRLFRVWKCTCTRGCGCGCGSFFCLRLGVRHPHLRHVSYGERHFAVFHEGHAAASMVVRAGTPVVDEDRLGATGDGVGGLVQNHFHSSQPVILFAEVRFHQAVISVPVLVLVLVLVLVSSWYNQLQLVHQWYNFTYSRSHVFRYGRKNTKL